MITTITKKGQRKYQPEAYELEFIKKNTASMTDQQLADKLGWEYRQIRHIKHQYGIRKQKQKKWTEAELKFLNEKWLYCGDRELSQLLNRSEKGICKKRYYLKMKRPDWSLFLIRSCNGQLARKKQCDSGLRHINWHDEGEKWWQAGSQRWLIRVGGVEYGWHRWRYEQIHGSIPKNHVVIFKDGDKQNTADDNLIVIPRETHASLNSITRKDKGFRKEIIRDYPDYLQLLNSNFLLKRKINESLNI